MSLSILLPALILGLLSLLLIVGVFYFVFQALSHTSLGRFIRPGFFERARFNRCERIFNASDAAFKQTTSTELSKLVHDILFLNPIYADRLLIDRVHQHHLLILERLIDRADSQASRIPSLPIIEDLISSRAQLLKAFYDANNKYKNLKSRRIFAREKTPAWALSESAKKVNDLFERLETNKRSLLSQLDELIRSLSTATPSEESVTYH